ncbi:putative ribonuclease H-like domain-containing protein [Tanacetum coccineum]
MFTPVNAAGSSCNNLGGSIPINAVTLPNADLPTDPLMPEDTTDFLNTGIFSGAYNDEYVGAEADFNNLEITINMDVKSAFLYCIIEEEVCVYQPPGFEDPQFLDKVYKVEKALYGLHQDPRAWYETLSTYLFENGFRRGLKVQQKEDGIFISQDKYVADILKKFDFATMKTTSTPMEPNKALIKDEEADSVDVHLYRSMIGSLMYLTASRPDIMFAVCACARFQVTPKMSHFHAMKRIFKYLKGQPILGLWYPRDSPFNLEAFYDSDYARASLDRKSIIGGCQFLGKRLISWQCKKQTIVANSTTEAEYVAAANCCGQVLWIQNQMLDYGFNFMNTKIYIDNESTICIVKNLVFHSKTKHIEIRHHFIRDCYEKKLIQVIKIHTDHNVADLLTKAFDVSSPTIYASYIEQFWNTATSKIKRLQTLLKWGGQYETIGIDGALYKIVRFGAQKENRDVKKLSRRKQKKTNTVPHPSNSTPDVPNEETVPTHSNDPLLSGEDRLKLTDLMDMCTKLSEIVLDLEHTKTTKAQEITNLKLRVKKLEKKEDASNQGKSIEDIDKDVEVSLVNETQRRSDDAQMFDMDALIGNEVFAKNDMIKKDQDVIPKEVVIQEPVHSTATIAPSTIPKAKGITFRDASESTTRTPTSVSSSSIKDKGKAKLDEPEVPLKKNDQIALDEEMARDLKAQIQAKLIEEERLARKKEEEANIALIESWDNIQGMMEADFELAQRLQQRTGEINPYEERSRLFVELMNKRKKNFTKLRAEEKRRKPPTKAQKRNLMSTYLKNMEGRKVVKRSCRQQKEIIVKKKAGNEQKQKSSKDKEWRMIKETDEHGEAKEDDELR